MQIQTVSHEKPVRPILCSQVSISRTSSAKISDQVKYEAATSRYVRKSAKMLQNGKSFEEIEQYLKNSRKDIQALLHPSDPQKGLFGVDRTLDPDELFFNVAYTPFAAKKDVHPGGFARIKAVLSGEKSYGLQQTDAVDNFKTFAIIEKSPLDSSKTIELTQYVGTLNQNRRVETLMLDLELAKFAYKHETVVAYHTDTHRLAEAMEIVEYLFQRTLDQTLPEDLLLQRIGEFHWWFANAMPYTRGSSAIGKMFVGTLFEYHGITKLSLDDLHRFPKRQGIDIDVWAMTMGDSKAFSEKYADAIMGSYKIEIPESLDI
jgi:hypothetical protein